MVNNVGGAEKRYKIILQDENRQEVAPNAAPGEFVTGRCTNAAVSHIETDSGKSVPYSQGSVLGQVRFTFVMPAENVTIS